MEWTLDAVREDIDARLGKAASDRHSPMHTPTVATDADARIMVLREWDANARTLRFHTDARAPKGDAIGNGAPVGVLFYDKEAGVQLRCRGTGRIVTEGKAVDAAWNDADTYARRCYLGEAPGTAVSGPASGLPDWVEGKRPTEAELVPARANFALLLVPLEEIDWYCLSHDGHRRAIFTGGKGRWGTP